MPWPGTPASQKTPPINPPSMRNPSKLNESSTMTDVAEEMHSVSNELVVHEQAFANLPAQIAAQAKAAAEAAVENISSETLTGVTSFNTETGAVIYFPNLGMVNDQLGNPLYLTQTSDAGSKIIVGDSTPVTVTLNPNVNLPWFTIIGNDSSASVILMPESGALLNGLQSIYPGGFAIIFYDGVTFWSEGVAIATDSSLGVVKPDGTTITVDSSGTLHVPSGPALPVFVYDSSVSGGPTSWNLPVIPIAGEVVLYSGAARLHYGALPNDWTGAAWTGTGTGITTNYAIAPGTLFADFQHS